jgi:hypothetical protein
MYQNGGQPAPQTPMGDGVRAQNPGVYGNAVAKGMDGYQQNRPGDPGPGGMYGPQGAQAQQPQAPPIGGNLELNLKNPMASPASSPLIPAIGQTPMSLVQGPTLSPMAAAAPQAQQAVPTSMFSNSQTGMITPMSTAGMPQQGASQSQSPQRPASKMVS